MSAARRPPCQCRAGPATVSGSRWPTASPYPCPWPTVPACPGPAVAWSAWPSGCRCPVARCSTGRPPTDGSWSTPCSSGRAEVDRVIKVLLVDDDPLVRAGLKMILAAADDIEVVGEIDDGADAVVEVRQQRPDVVLMDIRMPKVDGISATTQVRALGQPPAVIVLTTFGADSYVLDALRAGASGFLLKDTPPQEIVQAIRQVAGGGAMLSPSVIQTLIGHVTESGSAARRTTAKKALERLSEREREVALEVGKGRSNADIASVLFMSEATVKAHVSRLLTKLDLSNRVQIALLVHDAGVR
ncbi:MAG: response regulator [Propionibacteriales bacterium]|nr:response regulator [Propionibacteriales bacterium]